MRGIFHLLFQAALYKKAGTFTSLPSDPQAEGHTSSQEALSQDSYARFCNSSPLILWSPGRETAPPSPAPG